MYSTLITCETQKHKKSSLNETHALGKKCSTTFKEAEQKNFVHIHQHLCYAYFFSQQVYYECYVPELSLKPSKSCQIPSKT